MTEEAAESTSKSTGEFEPKIVGFLCNWCSYAGADLCGVSRYQYPTNLRVVRVMCSTRIDPVLLLKLFKEGADGVFVGGCHLGDCHYISGNYHTENKIMLAHRLLETAGIDPHRLRLEWISASEGERFSKIITEFTESIRQMGPTPVLKDVSGEKLKTAIQAAVDSAEGFRLRALVGRELTLTEDENVYGNQAPKEEFDSLLEKAADDEFARNLILEHTKGTPMSVEELSEAMNMPTDLVLEHIVALRQKNLLGVDRVDEFTPKYVSLVITGGE